MQTHNNTNIYSHISITASLVHTNKPGCRLYSCVHDCVRTHLCELVSYMTYCLTNHQYFTLGELVHRSFYLTVSWSLHYYSPTHIKQASDFLILVMYTGSCPKHTTNCFYSNGPITHGSHQPTSCNLLDHHS